MLEISYASERMLQVKYVLSLAPRCWPAQSAQATAVYNSIAEAGLGRGRFLRPTRALMTTPSRATPARAGDPGKNARGLNGRSE
jgi:hypothetical protein